jgi:hypothetical protein
MVLGGIGHRFAISNGGFRVCGCMSEAWVAICHISMIKKLDGVLFLRKEHAIGILSDRNAKEVSQWAEISHVKLMMRFVDDGIQQGCRVGC